MNRLDRWPPPDWAQVVIPWNTMLNNSNRNPNAITAWCDRYPGYGRWHLHGWRQTEGFAFRFEDARDATAFGLHWL